MSRKLPIILIAFLLLTSCRLVSTVFTAPATPPPQTALATTPAPAQASHSPTPPTPTLASVPPTLTPQAFPFALLPGAPLFSPAFLHADPPCAWMGAAGQVFGLDGKPISGLTVRINGTAGEQSVDASGLTGAASGYGPGGYEIQLADQPAPGLFWIELRDSQGQILSQPVSFQISGRCEQNLAVINFVQQGEYQLSLPAVVR